MKPRTLMGALIAASLMLSGCGSNSGSLADGKLTIGVYPSSALSLPIYIADQYGMFTDEDLDVDLIDGRSGPELISGLIGGTTDAAVGAPGTVIPAIDQGQQIRPLPPYGTIDLTISAPSSDQVKTLQDLPGKRIAIPSRGGAAEQYVNQLLREHGIDPSNIQFVTASPTASQIPLVRKGDVDAAVLTLASQAVFGAQGVPMTSVEMNPSGRSSGVNSYGLGTVLVGSAELADSPSAPRMCRALKAAGDWIADPANDKQGEAVLIKTMNIPAERAAEVWAEQQTMWVNSIDAERWKKNVSWVNEQTTGSQLRDVPFNPVC